MATFLTVFTALAALIPVLVKAWNSRIDTSRKATDAIIKRILMSLGIGMSRINGVSKAISPYLRDVRPSYDEHGALLKDYYTINKPYMEHMLKDLEACYSVVK